MVYIGGLVVNTWFIAKQHVGQVSSNDQHIDRYIGGYVNQGTL